MNPVVSYIKQTLQGYYPDSELVPMAKLLLTQVFGMSVVELYAGKDTTFSVNERKQLDDILVRLHMKKDGTISPPLKPAPRVSAVKIIFSRNASGLTEPSILLWMTLIPVPLYVWFPTSIVAMMTKQPPMNTLVYLLGRYFLYSASLE